MAIPLALAAALFVIVISALPRNHRSAHPTYWIESAGSLVRLRSANSWDADSAFWNGLNAYEAHDTERARELLQHSKASGGLEDLRRLYLASALINTARAKDALALLDQLGIDELPMPWRQDAAWMKFQALTVLHQSTGARQLLDQMANWPGRVGDMARKARAADR